MSTPHIEVAPTKIDAEVEVLGGLLVGEGEQLSRISWLKSDHFFELKHRWIYSAILRAKARWGQATIITVQDELKSAGHDVDDNYGSYVVRLMSECHDSFFVESAARMVFSAWKQREAMRLTGELFAAAKYAKKDVAVTTLSALNELMTTADPDSDAMREYLIHVGQLKDLPPVTWLIPSEIPEHGLALIYGPSGVGKSFFALHYALEIAKQHSVVYIAAEGEAGYHIRTEAWAHHHKVDLSRLNLHFFLNIVSLIEEKELGRFLSVIKEVSPKLLVIDTLALCMLPGDENSTRDMGLFVKAAKRLQKELGCSVLMVHHTGKENKSERGNSALRAACDVMIRLNGYDDLISVECSKTKDAAAFATRYIKLLPVLASTVIIEAEKVIQQQDDPLTRNQQKIIEALEVDAFSGMPVSDLVELTDMGRGSVLRAIAGLVKLGRVVKEGHGNGTAALYKLSATGTKYLTPDSPDRPDRPDRNDLPDHPEHMTDQVSQADQVSQVSQPGQLEFNIPKPTRYY